MDYETWQCIYIHAQCHYSARWVSAIGPLLEYAEKINDLKMMEAIGAFIDVMIKEDDLAERDENGFADV